MHIAPLRTVLSNFTLGFADGPTDPFALTTGLSTLGQTKAIIYAGMVEICAGSISIGVGGYLAARGSSAAIEVIEETVEVERDGADEDVESKDSVRLLSDGEEKRDANGSSLGSGSEGSEAGGGSPVIEGLSASLGYLVGGVLPLFPYFFVSDVNSGLPWSFVVCVFALFGSGSASTTILREEAVLPGRAERDQFRGNG